MKLARRSSAILLCAAALSAAGAAGCSSDDSSNPDTTTGTSDEPADTIPATTAAGGFDELPSEVVEEVGSVKFVLAPDAGDSLDDDAAVLTYEPRGEPTAAETALFADEFGVTDVLGELVPVGSETGWILSDEVAGGASVTIYDDARMAWLFSSGTDAQTAEGVAVSDDDATRIAGELWERLGVDASEFDVEVVASDNQRQVLGWLTVGDATRDAVWSVQVDPDSTVSAAAGQLVVPTAGVAQTLDDPADVLAALELRTNDELVAQARALAGVGDGEELDWPAAAPVVVLVTDVGIRFVTDPEDPAAQIAAYEFRTRDPLVSYLHPAILDR